MTKPEKKKKRYRITKADQNPKILDAVLTAIRLGAPQNHAAAAAGITYNTLQSYLKRGEAGEKPFDTFKADFDRAQSSVMMRMLSHVNKAAEKDARMAAWLLEKRYPKDFGTRATLEHSGKVDIDARVSVDMTGFEGRSEEEIEHYIAQGAFPDGTLPHPE